MGNLVYDFACRPAGAFRSRGRFVASRLHGVRCDSQNKLAVLLCVPLFSSVPLCVYKTSPDTIEITGRCDRITSRYDADQSFLFVAGDSGDAGACGQAGVAALGGGAGGVGLGGSGPASHRPPDFPGLSDVPGRDAPLVGGNASVGHGLPADDRCVDNPVVGGALVPPGGPRVGAARDWRGVGLHLPLSGGTSAAGEGTRGHPARFAGGGRGSARGRLGRRAHRFLARARLVRTLGGARERGQTGPHPLHGRPSGRLRARYSRPWSV